MGSKERYGIGAVAKLTGLTDHTIRVWERRYEAVVAERAPNGRRVYTPADVEKLGLLKRLTDRGLAISQIAGDDIDTLRERSQSLNDFAAVTVPDRVRVAILGELLPAQFAAHGRDIAPLELVVTDKNLQRFMADVTRNSVDVVVLESPVLDGDVAERLAQCLREAGASRAVLIHKFGRGQDVEMARDLGILVLRSPVDVDEVRAAVIRSFSTNTDAPAQTRKRQDQAPAEWEFTQKIAPRRFNDEQLTHLAQASTTIDCECPHHLAQLVSELTAFEVYSAGCASRDQEDAALHRFLHQTTAQARSMIEGALQRVADAENIKY